MGLTKGRWCQAQVPVPALLTPHEPRTAQFGGSARASQHHPGPLLTNSSLTTKS